MPQPHPFYKTARWAKLRKFQLAKEPCCRACLAIGKITPATVADHIVDWKTFPPERQWNAFCTLELQSVCPSCHDRKRAAKPRPATGLDGYPIPESVNLPVVNDDGL